MPDLYLSKSRYLAARQCDRRLWLELHAPEQATPLAEAQRHLFRVGDEVGRAAHALFPGGRLVDAAMSDHAAAVAQTLSFMSDPSIPAIFEAAFEYEGVRIRVDVLERRGGGGEGGLWGLREVKSSSRVKRAQHLPDLAIQKWVLDGSGVEIGSAELIHIDSNFLLGRGEIDWSMLFNRVELIDELSAFGMPAVGVQVEAMKESLALPQAPEREPAAFCKKPYLCRFWTFCTAQKPLSWSIGQTGANAKRKARMLAVTESGRVWFSDALSGVMAAVAAPIWSLDFETIGPAIPLFEGTNPFQAITFQWSLHRLGPDDEIEHSEHLASGRGDPRVELAQALVAELGRDEAPILVYSNYEKRCLKDLAACVPERADELDAITRRLVDLLPIVQANVYHPAFQGSFSIKKVGPALAPLVRYDDLSGVADGMAASSAFETIAKGELTSVDEARVRAALLLYCQRDTLALLEIYRTLCRVGRSSSR